MTVRDEFNLLLEPYRQAKGAARKQAEGEKRKTTPEEDAMPSKSTEFAASVTVTAAQKELLGEGVESLLAECLMVPKLTLTAGNELSEIGRAHV